MSGGIGKDGPRFRSPALKQKTSLKGDDVKAGHTQTPSPEETTLPMRRSPTDVEGISVESKALDQIASGEQPAAGTSRTEGGAKTLETFFTFGRKDKKANGATNAKALGEDVALATFNDVTGVVGTFSPAALSALKTPDIVRNVPWNLERPMALRHPNATALARALAKHDANGQSAFLSLANTALSATNVVDTGAGAFVKVADAPTRKAGESDYYDTPDFGLFKSDYTMATRTKTGFDENNKPTSVELQVLSSSTFDRNGIEMKGNAALHHKAPTLEEHGALERGFLQDNLVWGGEKQTLTPLQHFHATVVEKGELEADAPLQLQAMMHYRGESLTTTLKREPEPQLRSRLNDSIKGLQKEGGVEAALADRFAALADLAPTTWQGVEQMEAALKALTKDAALSSSPVIASALSAAEGLLLAAQERVFVPSSVGKDLKLSLQFSQVVDPGYWQALAPEDKHPGHVVPEDKILWGWLRVSADLPGGFGAHVESMRDAREAVDQNRAALVLRAAKDLGFPTTAKGVAAAIAQRSASLLTAIEERRVNEGGHVSPFDLEAVAGLDPEQFTAAVAARPPPSDATDEKMLAGAKALLERHQALTIEVEQSVSQTVDGALNDAGMGGGHFAVMPEEGSRFTEWSPRKDWYAHLLGDAHES